MPVPMRCNEKDFNPFITICSLDLFLTRKSWASQPLLMVCLTPMSEQESENKMHEYLGLDGKFNT